MVPNNSELQLGDESQSLGRLPTRRPDDLVKVAGNNRTGSMVVTKLREAL